MKKKTKQYEVVARPHFLPLVFYLWKRVKINLNRKGAMFPIFNNGLGL